MSFTWCKRLLLYLALSSACAAQITNPSGRSFNVQTGCSTDAAGTLNCTAFNTPFVAQDGTAVVNQGVVETTSGWKLSSKTTDLSNPTLSLAVEVQSTTGVRIQSSGKATAVSDAITTVGHYALQSGSNDGHFTDTGDTSCPAGQAYIGTWAEAGAAGNRQVDLKPGMCSSSSGAPSPGANGILACTGTNCSTASARTIAGSGTAPDTHIVMTNGDGVAGNPTIDIGTAVRKRAVLQRRVECTYLGTGTTIGSVFGTGGGCAFGGDNLVSYGNTAAAVAADANNGASVAITTSASATGGVKPSAVAVWRTGRTGGGLYLGFRGSLPASPDGRLRVGFVSSLTDATIFGADKLAASGVFFHFCKHSVAGTCLNPDTGSGNLDTTTYWCVITNNSGWTKADTGVAPSDSSAANDLLEVWEDASNNWHFYVNGSEPANCAAMSQTNKPAANTNMGIAVGERDLSGVSQVFKLETMTIEGQR